MNADNKNKRNNKVAIQRAEPVDGMQAATPASQAVPPPRPPAATPERIAEKTSELERIQNEMELRRLEREVADETRRGEWAAARVHHGRTLAANTYYVQTYSPLATTTFRDDAVEYGEDFLDRMAPQDPIEELLAEQMLFLRARTIALSSMAATETDPARMRVMYEALDAVTNNMRKLAQAFRDHRRPPRQRSTVMKIGQANVAEQQVVHIEVAPAAKKESHP